jgi:hypothetical protein
MAQKEGVAGAVCRGMASFWGQNFSIVIAVSGQTPQFWHSRRCDNLGYRGLQA